jgi:hypothetical protein
MTFLTPFSAVFLFTGLLAAAPAWAQPSPSPSPSAQQEEFLRLPAYDFERKDASPVRVGDTFELETGVITQTAPNPSLSLSLPPGVTALDDQGMAIEKVSSDAGKLKVTVVAIRSGDLTVPSLAITVPAQPVAQAVARTNPFPIHVISAIAPNDPKPQEAVPAQPPLMIAFPKWVVIAAVALGLLVLGLIFYAIYRWSRTRTRYVEPEPAGPPLSEDEAALAALGLVEKSDRSAAHIKKYVFQISDILKAYIGSRYGFDAPECTTGELLAHLEGLTQGFASAFDAGQLAALKELFTALDLVKFADHIPAPEESAQFVILARKFVLATRKRKVVA